MVLSHEGGVEGLIAQYDRSTDTTPKEGGSNLEPSSELDARVDDVAQLLTDKFKLRIENDTLRNI